MRLPIIPLAVMAVLIGGGAIFVLTFTGPLVRSLDAPQLAALVDVDGVETEVAIAPGGVRYALIASGDLWFVDLAADERQQLTRSAAPESAPA